MTTTATTTEPAPAARGFGSLKCLCCGQDANMQLYLDDVTTFRCPECEEEFTADDVRQTMSDWLKVLAWLELAPAK